MSTDFYVIKLNFSYLQLFCYLWYGHITLENYSSNNILSKYAKTNRFFESEKLVHRYVQSINLSQFFDSVKFRSGLGYHLVMVYYKMIFDMLMVLMKFSFVPQHFFSFFFRIRIRISLSKSITKVMLCVLKIPTKFGAVPQSFCRNQNSVQDQYQDQNHDFTLDFNTKPTFHT